VATKNNVAIQFSESSETISEPKNKFKDWIYQRQRHISTSKYYKVNHKLLLFLFPFSTTLFWVIAAPLFIFHSDIILISSLFSFRILLYYFVYYRTMKKLRTFDLFYFYPIMEFLHLFVQIFFVLLNSRYKTNSWR
jgi:antibiotic biosynthesis monooxygenase (ABM) superfamily enzyme